MPVQINSKNTPETYVPDVFDIIPEMQERADSIHYMIDSLRQELNLLPQITGREEIFFRSIKKCLGVLEQLSFDNLHNLSCIDSQLKSNLEADKKAVAP